MLIVYFKIGNYPSVVNHKGSKLIMVQFSLLLYILIAIHPYD